MNRKHPSLPVLLGASFALLVGGCVGRPAVGESKAREHIAAVAAKLPAVGGAVELPKLDASSTHADLLRYAVLNSPRVRAAYFDWARAVERITVDRSRPDPRFSFEADITDMIESAMPGLMFDIPGSKKLALAGEMASAESAVKYHELLVQVQQAAFALKKAYYQLYFLNAQIAVNRQSLELMADFEEIARRQNELGKVTMQDVLRAQIDRDQMATEIANLEDSRKPLLAQYKAALGLPRETNDPPLPGRFETTALTLDSDQLWAAVVKQNPRLQTMAAEIRAAEVALRLAGRSRMPDYSVGLEVDLKSSPLMFRPSFGMTLPIRRDKIAAEIAAAQASKQAGEARLQAEQIMLAVELAEKTFMYREASRNVALFEEALLPKAQQSLEVARSSYLSGRIDFFNLIDASRTLLGFELKRIEARTQRELALAELALVIAGLPPEGAPVAPTE